ncbi:MAG: IS110 family transposase, partial [Oscillospiraceae bacterium]|nr:IS110 family transposase [Oscillospiraceae bacterium]
MISHYCSGIKSYKFISPYSLTALSRQAAYWKQVRPKDGKPYDLFWNRYCKGNSVAAAVDQDGVIIIEPFPFANNHEGFKLLKYKLDTLDKTNLLIGLESTAYYAENVIFSLNGCGFELAVTNPVQTAAMRKTGIRKTKTDKVDSLLICKKLMVNSFRHYTENDIRLLIKGSGVRIPNGSPEQNPA